MKKILISLFVFIMIISCVNEQPKAKFVEVTFAVNDTLLAEKYICKDLGISFKPPRDWQKINHKMMSAIIDKTLATQDTAVINILPVNVFLNKERSYSCFLSSIQSKFINNYIREFKAAAEEIKINEGAFSHNGINFNQLLFSKDDLVTVKLIAESNKDMSFMIDYIVPSKQYESILRTIESSIGSIKKNK
ncbi:MAG: hypothetical protein U9P73_10775 [Candidatus Cloacimonadota bacterium]|nr:hypothetical protein [Candidatus Cloacimonadota bacterium]